MKNIVCSRHSGRSPKFRRKILLPSSEQKRVNHANNQQKVNSEQQTQSSAMLQVNEDRHVARTGKTRNGYRISVKQSDGKINMEYLSVNGRIIIEQDH